MPRIKPRRGRGQRGMTDEEELDLVLGSSMGAFGSDAERQASWFANREELIALVNPLSRPQAFWDYEQPDARQRAEKDFQTLERLGLLSDAEKALLAKMRHGV